jgi:hypothetical protein
MPTAEHYRGSAEDCRRLADIAQDETERDALIAMARQWDRLAEHKARIEVRQNSQTST